MDKPSVTDVILQQGIDFTVTVAKPGVLHKLKILPGEKQFLIKPIYLGTLLRIAKELETVKMQEEITADMKDQDFLRLGIKSVVQNKDALIKVIALAIVNENRQPPKSLVRFLDRNLTPKEALRLLSVVVAQMDVQDFLASMVSVAGMNLLRPEPTGGVLPAESLNTSGSDGTKSSGSEAGQT